jgi:hypothetical protein
MLLLLLACTRSDPADTDPTDTDVGDVVDTDTDDTDPPWDGEAPVPTEVIGRIEIVEDPTQQYSRLAVTLRAGALPTTQQIVATSGDCSVLDGAPMNNWECSPECTWGEQSCVNGECVDWPAMAPTGDVTITGLLPGAVTLEELDLGYYGTPGGYDGDLFGAGDPIRVTSAGGATPALDLSAVGVEDLEITVPTLVPGEPMTLTWTPSSSPSHVQVLLDTGWHGSVSLTTIWCETADDGDLTIPGELTAWIDIPSCGECELSRVRRVNRDVVDFGSGPIELLVGSEYKFVAWW